MSLRCGDRRRRLHSSRKSHEDDFREEGEQKGGRGARRMNRSCGFLCGRHFVILIEYINECSFYIRIILNLLSLQTR